MAVRAVVVLCWLLCCGAAGADQLDEILAANAAAIGGNANWSRVANLRLELSIREPGSEVEGTYVASRDGSMRIDIMAGGKKVFAEGLNQGKAWEWQPGKGKTAAGADAAAALRNGIEMPGKFFTLQQVRDRGVHIELVDSDEAAAAGQWQLRLTLEDGFGSDFFVDRHTHLVVRSRDVRAFHPSIDPTEAVIETSYTGEVWTEGVLRQPESTNRNLTTDTWLGTTTIRSIEQNIDIPEGFFRGPR